MKAIPSRPAPGEAESITGVGCPDCPGVLAVSSTGARLRFRCRVGHLYSLTELIKAKENRLEGLLWAPVTALEELTALLRESVAGGDAGALAEAYEERAARAVLHADAIRRLIEETTVTVLALLPSPQGDE